jgi:hypothetical protein
MASPGFSQFCGELSKFTISTDAAQASPQKTKRHRSCPAPQKKGKK